MLRDSCFSALKDDAALSVAVLLLCSMLINVCLLLSHATHAAWYFSAERRTSDCSWNTQPSTLCHHTAAVICQLLDLQLHVHWNECRWLSSADHITSQTCKQTIYMHWLVALILQNHMHLTPTQIFHTGVCFTNHTNPWWQAKNTGQLNGNLL